MATHTVGGTTPDYVDLQAWEDALPATLTEDRIAACREVTFDEHVIFAGVTPGSYKLRVEPDTGADHAGVMGAGPIWTPTDEGHVFEVGVAKTEFYGISIADWVGDSSEAFRLTADNCVFERLFGWGGMDNNCDFLFIGVNSLTVYASNILTAFLGRSTIFGQSRTGVSLYARNVTAIFGVYCGSSEDPVIGMTGTNTSTVFDLNNCYAHREDLASDGSLSPQAYALGSGGAWTGSSHNSASDTSTPGTSAQNSIAPVDVLETLPARILIGEDSGRDDYTGIWEDSWISEGAATTNYGSSVTLDRDNDYEKRLLIQINTASLGAITVRGNRFAGKIETLATGNPLNGDVRLLTRKFTESEVTWNNYASGSAWTTAGSDYTSLIIGHDTYIMKASSHSVGDWEVFAIRNKAIQDAIDGNGEDSADWFGIMHGFPVGGTNNLGKWHSSEATTAANRPYLEIYHGDRDYSLKAGGTGLIDNGTDVTSDGDYAVNEDIAGNTMPSVDVAIGAYQSSVAQTMTGTLVTQAGVGYDGVLAPGAVALVGTDVDQAGLGYDGTLDPGAVALAGTDVDQAAVGYDGVLGPGEAIIADIITADQPGTGYGGVLEGALFVEPIKAEGGWTGGPEDIDEPLPPVDADFIASGPAPGRVQLLNNGGFEDAFTVDDWAYQAGLTRTLDGGAQEGSYVAEATGSSPFGVVHGQLIPVDPTAIYEYSAWVRRTGGTIASGYLALFPLRANGSQCYVEDSSHVRGGDTYLTADVSPSDTSCQVASTARWTSFNYMYMRVDTNPDGSDLGNEGHLTDDIRLDATTPYSGTTVNFHTTAGRSIPKGTWIRPVYSGGTYIYPAKPNANFEFPGTWTKFVGRIGPGQRDVENDCIHGEAIGADGLFRPEQTQSRITLLLLYSTVDSTTIQLDDIRFERLDNVSQVRLRPTVDPLTSDRHHVRYRYAKDLDLGVVNLQVRLMQRLNQYTPQDPNNSRNVNLWQEIASWQHNDISTTPTTVKQTLSGAQADLITHQYDDDLWLEFEATS